MSEMELYEVCEACPQKNMKGIINTDKSDVCLIKRKLIENGMEDTCACGGLYLPKEHNSQNKIFEACHES